MYRLFSRIPKGLDPVADAFKKHVEADGMALVKEATEANAAKAAAGENANPRGASWCHQALRRLQAQCGGRHGQRCHMCMWQSIPFL